MNWSNNSIINKLHIYKQYLDITTKYGCILYYYYNNEHLTSTSMLEQILEIKRTEKIDLQRIFILERRKEEEDKNKGD